MVDIFDEVDEDLRAERMQGWLRRYGAVIVAAGILIVAATGAWQAWRWWQGRKDESAALSYVALIASADQLRQADIAGRTKAGLAFSEMAARLPEGYATLARLRAAGLAADAGDLPAASASWDAVAGDGSADPLLRDLATLSWVQHQIDSGDPAVIEARLKPLLSPDNPWHGLALEAQGLLDMRLGRKDRAKETFLRLSQDTTAPDGVRGRASGLLNRLGG